MSPATIRSIRALVLVAVAWLQCSLLSGIALAAGPDLAQASNGLWHDVAESDVRPADGRWIVPEKYRLVALDRSALQSVAFAAPREADAEAGREPAVIALPMPYGGVARFAIVETAVMAPELAARFPEIRTWAGQGIDDPVATVRLDWTPQGFHAMVLSVNTGRVFIDPYSRGDTVHYISYFSRDQMSPTRTGFFEQPPVDAGGRMAAHIRSLIAAAPLRTSGTQLRTYRLAVAATGEYTAFHGGTVALGQAAIVTAVNRVTGIYEAEVAVRLQLVANNNLIVYTNPATDPYTNADGGAMLSENQTNLDNVIGSPNYDIGHVFSTGGGGIAALGVPCVAGSKAMGVTGQPTPIGDGFWVDYVAHEMGHQFGGNHSFNSVTGSCNGNGNPSTRYEPGSGSTIMAYAGICGSDDLQAHSDPYFHTVNFEEIAAYTVAGAGNSCPVTTATGNSVPVPAVPAGGFTIPANTPFELTGSATDANGDTLTYNWEEYDLGTGGPLSNGTTAPFFRSWNATTSPTRTFPRLANLLAGTLPVGEVLPNATRALNFRMTVRDNRAGGGGVAWSLLSFNVTTAAGPFAVTAPNTAVNWTGGTTQTVTWNVANTTAAPVSCPNVDIMLSTDGGQTFPTVLAAATPNDGTQAVTVPNTGTTTARIKVKCSNSVFFDVSNVNFTIVAAADPSFDVFWRKSDGTNATWQFTGPGPTQFLATFPPGVPTSWTAMATGDVNGDGVPDVVWFDAATGQVAVWLMTSPSAVGSTTFPASVGAGSGWGLSAVGDVNGDGRADIVWRNAGTGQTLVWLMNASGTIASTLNLGIVPLAYALVGVGDFNGDGTRDLLWFRASDGVVVMYLMAANGTFTTAFPGAVGPGTWVPVRIGDFDGDGKADIFWRDSTSGTTAVWYQNGGTVAASDFFTSVPPGTWNIGSVGDFDADTRSDVMWYAPGSGNVVRWLMQGRHVAPVTQGMTGIGVGWQMVP
ncbi:MAG: FG-GAP-like repeat-containing protein [Burkholderiales bacterium]